MEMNMAPAKVPIGQIGSKLDGLLAIAQRLVKLAIVKVGIATGGKSLSIVFIQANSPPEVTE
jgi:hypothetical protein